ncbi:hypothetical protein AVEN_15457-1 [Araneus ventricosus]|uniref:Uncharacterized protein n=1 Tax=Araneus ventricosus TaxID=182803 RepID=A0A4Y2ECK1_ARAVE|nr:hypothetical protein AVEN_15457-1 [Araneus ventricosus]
MVALWEGFRTGGFQVQNPNPNRCIMHVGLMQAKSDFISLRGSVKVCEWTPSFGDVVAILLWLILTESIPKQSSYYFKTGPPHN